MRTAVSDITHDHQRLGSGYPTLLERATSADEGGAAHERAKGCSVGSSSRLALTMAYSRASASRIERHVAGSRAAHRASAPDSDRGSAARVTSTLHGRRMVIPSGTGRRCRRNQNPGRASAVCPAGCRRSVHVAGSGSNASLFITRRAAPALSDGRRQHKPVGSRTMVAANLSPPRCERSPTRPGHWAVRALRDRGGPSWRSTSWRRLRARGDRLAVLRATPPGISSRSSQRWLLRPRIPSLPRTRRRTPSGFGRSSRGCLPGRQIQRYAGIFGRSTGGDAAGDGWGEGINRR